MPPFYKLQTSRHLDSKLGETLMYTFTFYQGQLKGICKGVGGVVNTVENVGKTVVDGGGKVINEIEKGGKKVVDTLGGIGKGIGKGVSDAFGRKKRSTTLSRRKRAAIDCSGLKEVKLFSVKDTLKSLTPKFAGDIKGLKNKATAAFKTTVEIIKQIISYFKKIFYIATLVFMVYDGYR